MIGYDYLGLAHKLFPVDLAAKLTPAGSAIGVFDDPFGPVLPALKRMLRSGKFPAVRIQAHWDTGHRIVPITKLKNKLPAYEKLAREFKDVKVYVSHSCECSEKNREVVKQRIDLIQKLAPSCIPVHTVYNGVVLKEVITERHGADVRAKPGEIVSLDGENAYDVDVDRWLKENDQAAIAFLWGSRYNLREIPDPGQAVPAPDKRTAAPGKEYLTAIVRYAEPAGEKPTLRLQGRILPLKKPCLYKPFAEDSQGTGDLRENKPVLIIPQKAESVVAVTLDGQRVCNLAYGGTFPGGLHRYYSAGLYGYQIGKKAKAMSGSEFVSIKVNPTTFYEAINPAYRYGYHR